MITEQIYQAGIVPQSQGGTYYFPNNQSAYGTKPVLPAPVTTAPAATSTAISTGQQAYNQLPGYGAILGNAGANIAADVAGQLPESEIKFLQQQGAERGIATGTGGSANSSAAYMQALGLNSLQAQQTGLQDFQSILGTLPGAQISQNPNFYPSAGQASDVAQSNAVYNSAPNPAAAAAAAMQAANAGLAAGRGAVPGYGGGGVPAVDPSNPGGTAANVGPFYGSGVNATGALDTASMSQAAVDQILAAYNPLNQGQVEHDPSDPNFGDYQAQAAGAGTGSFDFGGGDLYSFN